jgi:hypothetical protein
MQGFMSITTFITAHAVLIVCWEAYWHGRHCGPIFIFGQTLIIYALVALPPFLGARKKC